jgi:SAM-dependent methyltransferase
MRAVLERGVPGVRAVPGTAEAIPLADGTVDAVFVAEAMHWFDPGRAAAEMARVLRPGGGVAVLYNRADRGAREEPWRRECHAVFEARRRPDDGVDPHDTVPWKVALSERFGALIDESFMHVHRVDADGLVALYASFSAIGSLPLHRRDAALGEIRGILERHGVRQAAIPYRTELTMAWGAGSTAAGAADPVARAG